jgi:hypothetical protein
VQRVKVRGNGDPRNAWYAESRTAEWPAPAANNGAGNVSVLQPFTIHPIFTMIRYRRERGVLSSAMNGFGSRGFSQVAEK